MYCPMSSNSYLESYVPCFYLFKIFAILSGMIVSLVTFPFYPTPLGTYN